MKTKYLLLLVLSIFCYLNSKAEEKKISLFCTCTEKEGNWTKDYRSISMEPTAIINENILHIYSNVTIENVSIVIKDKSGNIIYSNINMIASRCHTFEIYDLPEGDYTLEIEFGDTSYYGYFSY